jgi:uncharacterized protein
MATVQSAFIWYELMTSDVTAAKSFYGAVVGWRMQDFPNMTYTVLQAGETGIGGMMTLPQSASDAGMKPCWVGYIYAADVDSAAIELQRLGGKIHREPADIPDVGRFAMGADPQGAAFYLFKPGQPETARESVPPNTPGHIGWHELHAADWPKAFDFYNAMFGWLKGDSVDMGPMGTYQLFTINGIAVGGMMNSPAATTARFWLYYFNVDDIDAAGARITAAGGKIIQGPHQVPGGTWIVQATDPQGAWFALVGPKK